MLTYLLGHRPDEFGLVLSEEGFAPIKQVLQALAGEPGWGFVRRRHLEELAALLSPPQFEIHGELIRGGAPGPARLRRPPGELPPALLYLAISPKVHERVWAEGLRPAPGRELALARQPDLAMKLGRRRAPEPVLITVQAQAAARAGITFQGYGEDLFLTAALPRQFLQMPAPPQIKEKPKPARPARPQPLPGALVLDLPGILRDLQNPPSPPLKGREKKRHRGEAAWKSGARALRKKRRREE
jgi:putative RNA 2'-phosphotransferase